MMAFFLVMWLINSANEVTKARVASYFNPIKMTDAAPVKKGLRENVEPNSQKTNADGHDSGGGGSTQDNESTGHLQISREKLMENPMASLEQILAHAGNATVEKIVRDNGVSDPFDPKSKSQTERLEGVSEENRPAAAAGGQPAVDAPDARLELNKVEAKPPSMSNPAPEMDKQPPAVDSDVAVVSPAKKSAGPTSTDQDKLNKPEKVKREALEAAKLAMKEEEERKAQKLQQEIRNHLAGLRGAIDVKVTVKVTSEGTLIVFEDGKKRSMFEVGSASPNPALITLLGKVGELLNDRSEPVVIRGHTDGRRYRVGTYDNWQLSTDRAHIASYMLIRGGLAETRLLRIEGYGASKPAVPEDVFADANRRVEFLLARSGP
jgi:chemotaxis protein MotB